MKATATAALLAALLIPAAISHAKPAIERVTTVVPFPRGLAMVDGELIALARGRVRDAGGVSAAVNDRAGTLFRINPDISEPAGGPLGEAVRSNGTVLAEPTDPPFHLWDRSADPPESDTRTDRPYCTLRFHEATQSFYLCAFSGLDLAKRLPSGDAFSKNLTDAMLRYDLRTSKWYEVDRHDPAAGHEFPHHDTTTNPPPHGWLKGPDNCLTVGNWLYAVAKDNSVLVRYDLRPLIADPEAGPPPAELIMDSIADVEGLGDVEMLGQSGLAHDGEWLYISYRTTSEIIRIRVDEQGEPARPVTAQLVARFDPWDRERGYSPDLTDIAIDADGRLYVLSAKPAKVYRFTPDPAQVFDAREGREAPWIHFADATSNPSMKSENILLHEGWLYVTSGDGYDYQEGALGTIYRTRTD